MLKTRELYTVLVLALVVLGAGCTSGTRGTVPGAHAQLPMPKSVSPGLIAPAPMARTAILPASAMRSPSGSTTKGSVQGPSWSSIPGAASSAAAAPDGSLWVLATAPVGADKYIWHYVNGSWTNISGLAAHIAVAPNGTLYAVNSGGGTYAYSSGSWSGLGGGALAITVSPDGSIYVLSNGGSGPDYGIWRNANGAWSQVPGAGVSLAASADTVNYSIPGGTISPGGLYIVNSQGAIYYENSGGSFATLPANVSAIAATTVGGVYALGYPANASGNTIYYYNLNTPGWTAQPGAGVSLSTNGSTLYVIGASGGIYSTPITRTLPPKPSLAAEYALSAGRGPWGIATGADGNLWFAENNGNQIAKITTAGTVTEYPIPTASSQPQAVAAGPDGNIWFTELGGKIGKITPAGLLTEFPKLQPPPNYFTSIWDIAAGPDGNMWFTEFDAKNIGRITPGGAVSEFPVSSRVTDITAGPDGNMWFNEYDANKVGKITTNGVVTEYTVGFPGAVPWRLAAGPDGNMWFAEGGTMNKITPSGSVTSYRVSSFSALQSITAGPDGNLWFTENGDYVGNITPSGVSNEYPIPTTNSQPWRITAGPDGNIWFTEYHANQIGKFIP